MAVEKFQSKPWHDNPNHAGYHSNRQRLEASEGEIEEYVTVAINQVIGAIKERQENEQ